MEFSHHFLREALCVFRFEVSPEQSEPAVEYFHRFYVQLKEDGFVPHQKQPYELTIKIGDGNDPHAIRPELNIGHHSLVLQNEATGYAIIIGVGLISFNCLKPYPGWQVFLREHVTRYFPVYNALGIQQKLQAAQMAYINDFSLAADEAAPEYLAHLPQLTGVAGAREAGHVSQDQFKVPPATTVAIQTQVTVSQPGTATRVVLECNATTQAESAAFDALTLVNTAHTAARAAFMSVATQKFKDSIA
ncbi:hypothetical protein A0257_12910 [Hymenobacter psoromatis]|nr:hypothetical protein A0257_12910 [Hymenobacter psoromatis]